MDKRTRILTGLFLGVVGVLAFSSYVYPNWVEPLLTIDDQIAGLQDRIDELNEAEALVDKAKYEYRGYIERIGSMDPEIVQNRVKKLFDELVLKHTLANATVVPPRRVNTDKKSQITTMVFNISAEGSLKSIVDFLKEVSEMPYVMALNNPKLAPAGSSSRERKTNDQITLNTAVELMILPQQKVIGERFEDEKLRQPAQHTRYVRSDYSTIWAKNPFVEFQEVVKHVPPPPVTPRKEPEHKEPPPPPPPPDKRWRDRDQLTLTMAMLMNDGQSKFDEVMLYNQRSKENRYIRVDQDFDGGKLLYVHQRGVLVGREDGRFVYAIGDKLSSPFALADAVDYPEIQLASSRIETPEESPETPERTLENGAEPAGIDEPVQHGNGAKGVARSNARNRGAVPAAHPDKGVDPAVLAESAEQQPVDVGPIPADAMATGVGPDGIPLAPMEDAGNIQPAPTADGIRPPQIANGAGRAGVNGDKPADLGVPKRTGSPPRARVTPPPGLKDRATAKLGGAPSNVPARKMLTGDRPKAIAGGTKEQKPADPDEAAKAAKEATGEEPEPGDKKVENSEPKPEGGKPSETSRG